MQISKLTQKWVFDGQTRPKKICILKTNLVSNGGEPVRERREGEKREGEEEEENGGAKIKQSSNKVWKLLEYGFLLWNLKVCMNFHAIEWLLVIPKSRVCWDSS